ncbi:hypothetical protein TSH100_15295 [Azospirillum sp. TSH100]|uniref:TOMM precursor leader peptide-binding protein n=1 Tax=Azospirillum sp. TSH100 TaxID=652764 RepID=UPI000D61D4D3|nr:TOMM precursor leader peptide-binding protein [Azospirillum sp. TSH100]PWC85513.1 hypothetical protein TSH100_15295 [Azospirillum sp. TSH100]
MNILLHPALAVHKISDGIHIRGAADNLSIQDEHGDLERLLKDVTRGMPIENAVQTIPEERRETVVLLVHELCNRGILIEDTGGVADIDLTVSQLDFASRAARAFEGGIIGEAEPPLSAPVPIFIEGTGLTAEAVRESLLECAAEYVQLVDDLLSASFAVICSDWEDASTFSAANRRCVEAQIPATFVVLNEGAVRIGPLVIPQQSACFDCLTDRLLANAAFPEELRASMVQIRLLPEQRPGGRLAARLAASLACLQILKFIMRLPQLAPSGDVMEFDLIGAKYSQGRLLRSPRCKTCGPGRLGEPVPSVRASIIY